MREVTAAMVIERIERVLATDSKIVPGPSAAQVCAAG
jgi:hypothetical protein